MIHEIHIQHIIDHNIDFLRFWQVSIQIKNYMAFIYGTEGLYKSSQVGKIM